MIFILFLLYIVPSYIAVTRNHNNATAIIICNLFFGWSGICWIVSLIWAFTNDTKNI